MSSSRSLALGERIAGPSNDVGGVVELRDRRDVRLDRVEAGLVDRRLVHARAVQPADLLFDRTGGGMVGAGVRRFDDARLPPQALLAQLEIGRASWRERVCQYV